jgi:Reverse transcriptase (RNA-dependent DNA polymerase).
MIFTTRQVVEKSLEQKTPLCVAFIDLSKAFDSVDRTILFKILETVKCPPNLLDIIKALHSNTISFVQVENCKTPPFTVKTGVRQGCVITPLLFIIYMQVIIQNISCQNLGGIDLIYRDDQNMFNSRNMRAKTKTKQLHFKLKTVQSFKYLGTIIKASGKIDEIILGQWSDLAFSGHNNTIFF